MSTKELLEYCLAKQEAYIDFPFGNDYPVVKVKSKRNEKAKIFAEFYTLAGKEIFTFSTDADSALTLRMEYDGSITRGCTVRLCRLDIRVRRILQKFPTNCF